MKAILVFKDGDGYETRQSQDKWVVGKGIVLSRENGLGE
jgi:hypothetical protein